MKTQHILSERQTRLALIFTAVLLAVASLLIIAARSGAAPTPREPASAAAYAITGAWSANLDKRRQGEIHITISRRSDKGGDHSSMMGTTYPLSDLQGVTESTISSSIRSDVTFNIVREPGTLAFEGYFHAGKGAGMWKFMPNAGFTSEMQRRGYSTLNDSELLRATFHDVTIKYVDDLRAAGFKNLTFEQVTRGSGHDVTIAYISEMRAAGFTNLTLDELIRARNHDIDSKYLAEVSAMGFAKNDLGEVIRLRNHDIDQAFIDEMRSAGFDGLSPQALIRLKNHDVSLAFINEIKGEGYASLSPDLAIRLKNHDIDRDFIRRAKAQGYSNASLDELIRLSNRDAIK